MARVSTPRGRRGSTPAPPGSGPPFRDFATGSCGFSRAWIERFHAFAGPAAAAKSMRVGPTPRRHVVPDTRRHQPRVWSVWNELERTAVPHVEPPTPIILHRRPPAVRRWGPDRRQQLQLWRLQHRGLDHPSPRRVRNQGPVPARGLSHRRVALGGLGRTRLRDALSLWRLRRGRVDDEASRRWGVGDAVSLRGL